CEASQLRLAAVWQLIRQRGPVNLGVDLVKRTLQALQSVGVADGLALILATECLLDRAPDLLAGRLIIEPADLPGLLDAGQVVDIVLRQCCGLPTRQGFSRAPVLVIHARVLVALK